MEIITSNQQLRHILAKNHPDMNIWSLPIVKSVVVNVGIGSIRDEKDTIQKVIELLQSLTGQKPIASKAKKAVSAFKTRQGNIIGYKVTLRGQRAFDFTTKLFHFSLPRIRDFRGLSGSFINHGTMNIGLKESSVLPENSENNTAFVYGLQITISLTTGDPAITRQVMELLGAKFK